MAAALCKAILQDLFYLREKKGKEKGRLRCVCKTESASLATRSISIAMRERDREGQIPLRSERPSTKVSKRQIIKAAGRL